MTALARPNNNKAVRRVPDNHNHRVSILAMNLHLSGIGISRGIVSGRVMRLSDWPQVSERRLPPRRVEGEVSRYLAALQRADEELGTIRSGIPAGSPPEIAGFIEAHQLMLRDSTLSTAVIEIIRARRCNAEWALKLQRDELVTAFESMDNPYLRSRRDDVDQVVMRVQRLLIEGATRKNRQKPDDNDDTPLILVAEDISPADIISIPRRGVAAFVTEMGGPLSHTAILARSLRIPAVVGVHHARRLLHNRETLIIDGKRGTVVASPDEKTLKSFRRLEREDRRHQQHLRQLKGAPSCTRDGCNVSLQANIELPDDIGAARRVNAEGVGLYRTEFLYLNREDLPDEEEQLAAYRKVIRAMKGAPVTIRTLDLGADKPLDPEHGGHISPNPALGLRAIRLCLNQPTLFRPQLRALLRASAYGPLRIMLPMIASLEELQRVQALIGEIQTELDEDGLRYDPDVPVGIMIEVPAAALASRLLAPHVDFFSIGTNDLIQYTLAIDRADEEVNYLYDPLHPAVLQLIDMTISAGKRAGIPVSMCGEMAGDPGYTRLLLGLGLNEFSVPPTTLLEVKHLITTSDSSELARQCQRILRSASPARINHMLAELNQA